MSEGGKMKSVAILIVSVLVIAFVVQYCILPPRRMAGYVLGDGKCDICGEEATYKLMAANYYLTGEYCDAHRWMGVINAQPIRRVMHVLLGATVFGVVYALLSLLPRPKPNERDEIDVHMAYPEI
jgi:hypothetical protein